MRNQINSLTCLAIITAGMCLSPVNAQEQNSKVPTKSRSVLVPRLMSAPVLKVVRPKDIPSGKSIGHAVSSSRGTIHHTVGDFYAGSQKGKWLGEHPTKSGVPVQPPTNYVPSKSIKGHLLKQQ